MAKYDDGRTVIRKSLTKLARLDKEKHEVVCKELLESNLDDVSSLVQALNLDTNNNQHKQRRIHKCAQCGQVNNLETSCVACQRNIIVCNSGDGDIFIDVKSDEGDVIFNVSVFNNDGTIVLGNIRVDYSHCTTDKNTIKLLRRLYTITNQIYPLRDNCKWKDFYSKIDKGIHCAKEKNLLVEEIFMIIEKSIALRFQGRREESMAVIMQAMKMIFHRPVMQEFLTSLMHCQLAALYRRESKWCEAKSALDIAKQNLEMMPCNVIRAYILFEEGSNSYIKHFYSNQSECSMVNYKEDSKKVLKECISTWDILHAETDSIYSRRPELCLTKLVNLILECVTAEARSQPVSEACVREAKQYLGRVEQRSAEDLGECAAMLFYSAKAGYYFRNHNFNNAQICARQALTMAQEGFQSHVCELEELLKDIDDCLL